MKDIERHIKIRITKSEFDLISGILDENKSLFTPNQINNSEYILSFVDFEQAMEFDELIKDKLVCQGFDREYNPNKFGLMCENVIDKMYEILK